MSLLSRKLVIASLGAERIAVVELSMGLGIKLVSQHTIPVSASPSGWKPALDAFSQWLTAANIGKADIGIQLSSGFVRYAMLPFDATINSDAENRTIAGLLFESIYGESAREWRLALDEVHYGDPTLVAAIDGNLAVGLEQLIESHECKIKWMRPYVASAINAFSKQIQRHNGLLVIIEFGQATIFDIKAGKLTGVRKVSVGKEANGEEMAGMLRRELLVGGIGGEPARVFLHVADGIGFKTLQMSGIEIVDLQFDESAKRLGAGYEMLGLEELK